MSVTDYKVARGVSVDELAANIAADIADSWQTFNSGYIDIGGAYCQPMIKGSQVLVGATGDTGATGATGPQTTFYGTSTTAANTFTATITSATPLVAGEVVFVKFTNHNTGAATLNINGVGAKAIVTKAGAALSASAWADGEVTMLMYDGTSFILNA